MWHCADPATSNLATNSCRHGEGSPRRWIANVEEQNVGRKRCSSSDGGQRKALDELAPSGVDRRRARARWWWDRRGERQDLRATEQLAVAVADQCTGLAGPNKPMVPTAPTHRNEHPLAPRRRHIGQPLGSRAPGLVNWSSFGTWSRRESAIDRVVNRRARSASCLGQVRVRGGPRP